MSAGYSPRPLFKKLGIKENFKVRLINEPAYYFEILGDYPTNIEINNEPTQLVNFIHFFVKTSEELNNHLPILKDEIEKNGMIWVSWYKKSSKIPTDVTEDTIRNLALSMGLVDVKVCAVDEKWSGLKLVWRKENR